MTYRYLYQKQRGGIVHTTYDRGCSYRWQLRDSLRLSFHSGRGRCHDVVIMTCAIIRRYRNSALSLEALKSPVWSAVPMRIKPRHSECKTEVQKDQDRWRG